MTTFHYWSLLPACMWIQSKFEYSVKRTIYVINTIYKASTERSSQSNQKFSISFTQIIDHISVSRCAIYGITDFKHSNSFIFTTIQNIQLQMCYVQQNNNFLQQEIEWSRVCIYLFPVENRFRFRAVQNQWSKASAPNCITILAPLFDLFNRHSSYFADTLLLPIVAKFLFFLAWRRKTSIERGSHHRSVSDNSARFEKYEGSFFVHV